VRSDESTFLSVKGLSSYFSRTVTLPFPPPPQQPQRPAQQPQNNGYAAARNAPQQPTNFDDDSIPF
jgi:hypothetical protein